MNFCTNTNQKVNSPFVKYKEPNNSDNLIRLAGDIENSSSIVSLNSENKVVITTTLSPGDKCEEPDQFYSIVFNFICNPGKKTDPTFEQLKEQSCNYTFSFETKEACPKTYYPIMNFLNKNSIFFGVVIIIVGLYLASFGGVLKEISAPINFSFTIGLVLSIILFYIFWVEKDVYIWIVIGISIIFGTVPIIFFYKNENFNKIFIALLGVNIGYSLGVFAYDCLLQFIYSSPSVVYWSTIVVFCSVIGIISNSYEKIILTFGISSLGGFFIVKGLGVILFKKFRFLNEEIVLDLIGAGEISQMKEIFSGRIYVYLGIWAGITIVGGLFQSLFVEGEEKDDYKSQSTEPVLISHVN